MESELYFYIVTLAAVIYSGLTKFIQEKMVNKKEMQDIQLESKKINDEYKEASKRNDKTKMEEIAKKQMEFFPKMSKIMLGQMKVLAVILIMFFAFTWGVTNFDPTLKDDIVVELKDDGAGCD